MGGGEDPRGVRERVSSASGWGVRALHPCRYFDRQLSEGGRGLQAAAQRSVGQRRSQVRRFFPSLQFFLFFIFLAKSLPPLPPLSPPSTIITHYSLTRALSLKSAKIESLDPDDEEDGCSVFQFIPVFNFIRYMIKICKLSTYLSFRISLRK